jgi:predicted nuclease with TOPRIM domain
MARTKSIASIEAEIAKVEADLAKTQEKYDTLAARLLELQKQEQDYEAKQIMDAFRKSGKSFQELMIFP